ncbi:Flp pilus assembly protein CpaB [Candidatus Omnitrophota bacterium]
MQLKEKLREKSPLIIAVVCGIIAILLLNVYLRRREAEMWARVKEIQKKMQPAVQAQPERTGIVLLAATNIAPQTPVTPEDLVIKEMPVKYIQPGAITSLDAVIGQISSTPIAAGEQILKTKLLPPGRIGKTLSEITPEGKRAVTVTVDSASTVSGLLKPGDFVDVLALLTPPSGVGGLGEDSQKPRLVSLFQGVEVLAVGSEFYTTSSFGQEDTQDKSRKSGVGMRTATLALAPQESILLSFVQEQGKIKLVIRSSDDVGIEPVETADWDALFRYLYPTRPVRKAEPRATGPQTMIEVYRGLERGFMPLSEEEK